MYVILDIDGEVLGSRPDIDAVHALIREHYRDEPIVTYRQASRSRMTSEHYGQRTEGYIKIVQIEDGHVINRTSVKVDLATKTHNLDRDWRHAPASDYPSEN